MVDFINIPFTWKSPNHIKESDYNKKLDRNPRHSMDFQKFGKKNLTFTTVLNLYEFSNSTAQIPVLLKNCI